MDMYEARQNKENVSRVVQNFNSKKTERKVKKQIKCTNKHIIQAMPPKYIDNISDTKYSKTKKEMFMKFIERFIFIAGESELSKDPFTQISIIGLQSRINSFGWTELFINIGGEYVSENLVPQDTPLDKDTLFELKIVLNMSKIKNEQDLFTTFFHEWYAHANAGDYLTRIHNTRLSGKFSKAADDIANQEHKKYGFTTDSEAEFWIEQIIPGTKLYNESVKHDIGVYHQKFSAPMAL